MSFLFRQPLRSGLDIALDDKEPVNILNEARCLFSSGGLCFDESTSDMSPIMSQRVAAFLGERPIDNVAVGDNDSFVSF